MVDYRVADTTLHLNRTVRKRKMYSFVDQRYDAALRTTFAYLPLLLKNEAIIADKLKSKLKKALEARLLEANGSGAGSCRQQAPAP